MPLNRFAAFWVARAALMHKAKGRAFFLGRLWPLDLRVGEFRKLLAEYELTAEIPPEYGDDTLMDDALVCKLLGYASCDSLDFDDSEGATVLHDMNVEIPSSELHGSFGTIFNFGTMEHIFHIPNFLANIYYLLEPAGVIVHSAPMNNCAEHGFYQFSPTLFFDYYIANGFDFLECSIVRHHPDAIGKIWDMRPYHSYDHSADHYYGKLRDTNYDVVFIARKNERSGCRTNPIQFRYRR